eukprot:Polyplicarium_translucidae@DN1408_c0_g2_i2.p1
MQVDDAEGGVEALSPLMQDLHIGTIRKRRRSRDAEMLQTTRRRSKAARLPAGCEESQAERREEQPGRGSGGQIRSESTAIVPWKPPIVPGFPPEVTFESRRSVSSLDVFRAIHDLARDPCGVHVSGSNVDDDGNGTPVPMEEEGC